MWRKEMTSLLHVCPTCQKGLSTKYTLANHIRVFHTSSTVCSEDLWKCKSDRCDFSTRYKQDQKRHIEKCVYVSTDQILAEWKLKNQQDMIKLQTENELLRAELKKAQERPTTSTTHNHQQYHTVKITNYLASKEIYEKQTDPERVLALAKKELSRYYPEGQAGVARFLDEHVIRTDQNEMILCCTDPTRYRFRHLNEKNEILDDMRAQQFVKTVSEPVKKTAVELFQDRVDEMNDVHQQMTDPMEQLRLLKEMDQHRDLAHDIIAFDDASSNHAFLNTLADRLRTPSNV